MLNIKLAWLILLANIAILILSALWFINTPHYEPGTEILSAISAALGATVTLLELASRSRNVRNGRPPEPQPVSDEGKEIGVGFDVLLVGASFAMVSLFIFLIAYVELQSRTNKCFEQIFINAPRNLQTAEYSSNGRAQVYETCDDEPIDGKNDYLTITLQAHQDDAEAGVIVLLPDFHAGRFDSLAFLIRGEHGEERIGLKMKNIEGYEVTIWMSDEEENRVTTHWREVRIASDRFLGVSDSPLENITFFIKGEFAGTQPQIFYVAQIRFD